jgi:1-deoxy-D-xylulose-5-phosphate synthase
MGRLLDRIQGPQDLKTLSLDELAGLAADIRERMIETVARTGGHLAANLGVVELTLALHRVFDSPRDQIVWDTGHQCYPHKLLTGRQEAFGRLRQRNGPSGFPRRAESEHDCFDTGHAGTAVAVALGLAKARDLSAREEAVVAVVGDGAMTGGMALEAVNLAGHLKSDLIVVLNDNEMSIARNVGGLAAYLSRLRADPHYLKAKEDFEFAVRLLPKGETLLSSVERLKGALKQLMVPGMLFEELGFTYLGPVDGHNLGSLLETLTRARKIRGPVLVHVITCKGKGYAPAEEDACRFHRTVPFDIETGEPAAVSSGLSYTAIFGQTLVRLAEKEPRIVGITAAMRPGTGMDAFAAKFPERFFDVGIAEQTAVALAAGMAARDFRPVVAIYSTFLQRAYDQILHDVCLPNLPVVFAVDRAGLVGEDGSTHHGAFDLSYLRHAPNLTVLAPRDLSELAGMLVTALGRPGPVALRYPRGEGRNPPEGETRAVPVGQAEVLREGAHFTLLAVGSMVEPSLAAAELLARRGLEVRVVDARSVKPLDEAAILECAEQTGGIVTVEENARAGGFGSAVLEALSAAGRESTPTAVLGLPDRFVEHGRREELLQEVGLDPEGIAEAGLAFARRFGLAHRERLGLRVELGDEARH